MNEEETTGAVRDCEKNYAFYLAPGYCMAWGASLKLYCKHQGEMKKTLFGNTLKECLLNKTNLFGRVVQHDLESQTQRHTGEDVYDIVDWIDR